MIFFTITLACIPKSNPSIENSQNTVSTESQKSINEIFINTQGLDFDFIELSCNNITDVNGDGIEDLYTDSYKGEKITKSVFFGSENKIAEEWISHKNKIKESTWVFTNYMNSATCDIYFGGTDISFGPVVFDQEKGGHVRCVLSEITSEAICECYRGECENDGRYNVALQSLK